MTTTKKKNTTRTVGQPTKYKPEYCQDIIEFMLAGGDTVYKQFVVSCGNNAGSEVVDHPIGKLPALFEDFALKVGVSYRTLRNWYDAIPDFQDAYDMAQDCQRSIQMKNGIAGVYPTGPFCFSMKNMHGWVDVSKVEYSGEVAGPRIFLPEVEPSSNGKKNGKHKATSKR